MKTKLSRGVTLLAAASTAAIALLLTRLEEGAADPPREGAQDVGLSSDPARGPSSDPARGPSSDPARGPTPDALPRAFMDGQGPGWIGLGEADFVAVNCDPETWSFGKEDGVIRSTGTPVGVIRSKKVYENFELVVQWRHLRAAGNSGVFVWTTEDSIAALKRDQLPHGIEVQVLDLGYTEQFERSTGKKADWFTAHGDVFPVGRSKMTPFPPVAPDGRRSFPRKHLSKGAGEWNHYYVRAINGEVRLWVNGEEVSGGTGCDPRRGYLCLESEGSPVEFRGLRIREVP